MACENCNYVDTVIPMDYTKSAFQYINRKQYHNWKMIGIQATHDFVHGAGANAGITVDGSGRLMGVASGCKPIEEINQNNQMIGRGAWYFRAKVDGYSGQKSATYGIMGHCQSPGLVDRDDLSSQLASDVRDNVQPTAWDMEEPNIGTPMYRGWGLYQSNLFCACSDGYNSNWHMAVFIKEPKLDDDGNQQSDPSSPDGKAYNYYMQYEPDEDCSLRPDLDSRETCLARNSRRPGRFTSWEYLGGGKRRKWNTCEALSYNNSSSIRNSVCLNVNSSVFESNDILGVSGIQQYAPLQPQMVLQGVLVKLTSLPSCNHFDKVTPIKTGETTNPETGQTIENFTNFRCERAAIRFGGYCNVGAKWNPSCAFSTNGTQKQVHFNIQEYHYDRWDVSDDLISISDNRYKIFDELYTVPEMNYEIRVLAHKKSIIENYYNEKSGFEKSTWMQKRYLTGGKSSDSVKNENPDFAENGGRPGERLVVDGKVIPEFTSDPRGCSCQNPSDGAGAPYPIRPYSSFQYCANDFTCDKKCRVEISAGKETITLIKES